MNKKLSAPFPYFGGKQTIAHIVWRELGDVRHYIEPFFGSGAVLLNRPRCHKNTCETINDKDGFICNVWRSLQSDPNAVAKYCDWPVNHADLSARKKVLLKKSDSLLKSLIDDDKYYDVELAGYWIWAASSWVGSGLTSIGQRPHLSDSGKGVHKIGQIPHLSDSGKGVHKIGQRPHLSGSGMGVHKIGQRPHLSDSGMGVQEPYQKGIYKWFRELSERFRYVRVVCGDYTRVLGGNWQDKMGNCGIFFDPPYGHDQGRANNIYNIDEDVTKPLEKWCLEKGKIKSYRIVVAGYDGEYKQLEKDGWRIIKWKAQGGYASFGNARNENCKRERLWVSHYCKGNFNAFFK